MGPSPGTSTMNSLIHQTSKLSLASDKRSKRIHIDGALLEGGGQILRNASAYACILRQPVQITDIRGKRYIPGLRQQHLSGLQLLAKISGGVLEGGRVESREILLTPGKLGITETDFTSDQQGAGATTLVFQSALPVLLFSPHETTLVLRGGTNVQRSPTINHTEYILLPFLRTHFGIECDLEIRKRGFASHGGGEVKVRISPLEHKLKCISLLDRGEIVSFTGIIWTARQEYQNVTSALEECVTKELAKKYPKIPLIFTRTPPTPSPSCGLGILLYATTSHNHRLATSTLLEIPTRVLPGTLSKQEVKARERGIEVVRRLLQQIPLSGAVDEHLADQIVIFMALATSGANPPIAIDRGVVPAEEGKKRRCEVFVGEEVSLHTETAMRIAEMMLRNIKFSVEKRGEGGGMVIVCEKKVGYEGG